jgi:AcrR family transcriptional regulator
VPARRRRSPEAARAHILARAADVFAHKLPDAVGLRELAAAAGVSHALLTHYFQSYENLVRAVIDTRLAALRDQAFARLASATFTAGSGALTEAPMLDVLLDLLEDRALVRLLLWALLSGRTDLGIGQAAHLGRIVDAMHARLERAGLPIARARLELAVSAAVALVLGWSVAAGALDRALGRAESLTRPELRRELERMLRTYVLAA